MKHILIAYVVSVLANRTFNWLWWWGRNVKAGPLAYYREHGPTLAATLILHVFVFPLWNLGLLLPLVNAALKGAELVGAGVSLQPFEAVTPPVTLACGWIIDSVTSRIGMALGGRFAILGGDGPAGKESK